MHIYMHKDERELCDLENRRLSNVKRNEEVLGLKKVYYSRYHIGSVLQRKELVKDLEFM